MRFRRYLGKNYIRTETIINAKGEEEEMVLPISTIYILGYNLIEYDTPGLLINNQVIDSTTKQAIAHKNDFVKLLTHPSYILQTKRLRPERRTKLEKFLAIFDQTKKTDDKYLLNLEDFSEDDDISSIAQYLNRGTLDEELLRQLELEEDIDKEFQKMEDELVHTKKEKLKAEKEKLKAEQEKLKAQQSEAKALQKIFDLAKMLKDLDITIEQIAEKTGLSNEEIQKL